MVVNSLPPGLLHNTNQFFDVDYQQKFQQQSIQQSYDFITEVECLLLLTFYYFFLVVEKHNLRILITLSRFYKRFFHRISHELEVPQYIQHS